LWHMLNQSVILFEKIKLLEFSLIL
jgi:hypothetical protein